MIGNSDTSAQERLQRHGRANRQQREREAKKRGHASDQDCQRHRVPGHAALSAGQTSEAPDRSVSQLSDEQQRRERARIIAYCRAQHGDDRPKHENRDAAANDQQRSGHEHLAATVTKPRQASGEARAARQREGQRAPAKRCLLRLPEASRQRDGPAFVADQHRFQHEPRDAERARHHLMTRPWRSSQQHRHQQGPQPNLAVVRLHDRRARQWRSGVPGQQHEADPTQSQPGPKRRCSLRHDREDRCYFGADFTSVVHRASSRFRSADEPYLLKS